MRLPSPSLSLSLILLSFLPACGDALSDRDCGDRCDEEDVAALSFLDCWIEVGDSSDPFFRTDKLMCSFAPGTIGLDIFSVALQANTADGNVPSELLRPENAGETIQLTSLHVDDYPFTLAATINVDEAENTRGFIGFDALRKIEQTVEINIDEPSSPELPIAFTTPFEIWDVNILNREQGTLSADFAHTLEFADETRPVDGKHTVVDFGFQSLARVVVSKGTAQLPLSMGVNGGTNLDVRITGPGTYEASEGELVLVPESAREALKGHPVSLCTLLVNQLGDNRDVELVCSAAFPPAVKSASLRLLAADGSAEEFALSPGEEIRKRVDLAADAPARVDVEVVATVESQVIGLGSLQDRTHTHRQTIHGGEGTQVFHLPYKIWTIELADPAFESLDLLFLGIDLPERSLELGLTANQQFALEVEENILSQGDLVHVAVPADAETLSAAMQVFDVVTSETKAVPVELGHGTWIPTESGLLPADN